MKKFLLLFLALGILAFLAIKFGFKEIERFGPMEDDPGIDRKLLDEQAGKLREINRIKENKQRFCENDFLPFVAGANWRYNAFYGNKQDILKLTVPELKEGNYFWTAEFETERWNFETKLACSDSRGLVIDSLNLFRAFENTRTIVTPLDASGFLIPSNLGEITSWNFELETKNEVLLPDSQTEFAEAFVEKATGVFTLKEEEEMETPWGKTKAKRIEARWVLGRIPIEIAEGEESEEADDWTCLESDCDAQRVTADLILWIANQAGIIRSVYKEKGKDPVILELRSFQIPAGRSKD